MSVLKTTLAAACLVAVLVVTPSAQAAVTASSITTPTDVSYYIYNNDSPNTLAVSGTTTGGTTGDFVDVNCYAGDRTGSVASNVAVNADGSFSAPAADLSQANIYRPCVLRAVPAGTTPNPLTPFAGPRILVGYSETEKVSGGPNDGQPYDFYTFGQQLAGGFDYDSLGSCGIDDGYLIDSNDTLSTATFYCNDWLTPCCDFAPTRSQLQIDGANAYPTDSAHDINDQASGLPAVTYSYSLDPNTGDLVIHDTEPLVKCTDVTYPPTAQSCPTFVSAGVTDQRTITQDHDGRVAWITDVFSSTDGGSHTLDLLWQNDQHFGNSDAATVEYEFPGESSYSTHAVNDTVSLPNTPGTIFIRKQGAADGDTSTGQGAIVYDRAATAATFDEVDSSQNDFTLHQTATVPANSSTTFRAAYVQDFTAANVASLADLATKTFKGCTVPKLKGKKLAAAKHAITNAGCTVGKVKKAFSTKVKKGRVISSKPKAGKHVGYQAKVSLTVSKGKKK